MAALATAATVPLPQPLIDTKFVVPPEIEVAVRNVLDDDGKRHHKGAKCIVKWIQSLESGRVERALDYLINAKAHERFARFFTDGPTEVQLLAGVLFGFLACGNAHHTNSAIRQNISGSAWILGNLACESPAYATTFISAGVPEQLVESIKHYINVDRSSTNTPQTATFIWTLNSLEKGGPYLLDENLRYELINFFVKLLKEETVLLDDIVQEICLFFHGCCVEPRWIEALVNADVTPSLIDIVAAHGPALQTTALQVIGAVSASEYDNVLIQGGVFSVLQDILVKESTLRLAEDACWIMANLTDCTEHVDALMRDVRVLWLLCTVIKEVKNAYEHAIYEVRTREALRVIANVVKHGTPTHVRQLVVEAQCIGVMVGLLKCWIEKETLMLVIDTLWELIRQGERYKVETNDGGITNAYWALFDIASGDEGLRGLGEHPDSTVANTAKNTLAMLAEMTESVAAAQAEAARTASPELLSRASLHPSGPFQDFPGLVVQSDPLDGPPLFDRLSPVRLLCREGDTSSSGSTAEVRRQLYSNDDDTGSIGVVEDAAAEVESVVPADDDSCVQGPPSTVTGSGTSQAEGGGSTPSSTPQTPSW